MYRQDFIKRQIELLAKALAAMAGFRHEGKPQRALDVVAEGYSALGIDAGMLRLDDRSLVMMLGSPDKVQALAQLLDEEAATYLALGQTERALLLGRRAAGLRAAVPGS